MRLIRCVIVVALLLCHSIAFAGDAEAGGPLDDSDPRPNRFTTASVPASQSTVYEFLGSATDENVLTGTVSVTGVKRYGYETIIVCIADASTNVLISGVTSVTWGATALDQIQSGSFQNLPPPYSQVSIYQLESSPGNPNAQSAAQTITVTWGGAVKPNNKAVMVVGIRNGSAPPCFDFCDSPQANSGRLTSGNTSSSTAVTNEMVLGAVFRLGPSTDEDIQDYAFGGGEAFTAGNRVGTNSGLTSGGLSLDVNIDTAWFVVPSNAVQINFGFSWGTTDRDFVTDIAAFKPYP